MLEFVQQKNPNNLDILAFWLANTSRLLHDMKQYSGDRVSKVPSQNYQPRCKPLATYVSLI